MLYRALINRYNNDYAWKVGQPKINATTFDKTYLECTITQFMPSALGKFSENLAP